MAPQLQRQSGSLQSRRIRRHATGSSNASELDKEYTEYVQVKSSKLVRSTEEDRKGPLQETNRQDQRLVERLSHKVFNSLRPAKVRQAFTKFDTDHDKRITVEQFRQCVSCSKYGISKAEQDRIVQTVDKDASGLVEYESFMEMLEEHQPLGSRGEAELGEDPMTRNRHATGCANRMTMFDWKYKPLPRPHDKTTTDNTFTLMMSDQHLINICSDKFRQHRHKLRYLFRHGDPSQSCLVDKETFVAAVAKLRVTMNRFQVERLFDMIDAKETGAINYEDFLNNFDGAMPKPIQASIPVQTELPLPEAFQLTEQDLQTVWESPAVQQLQSRLHVKGGLALDCFSRMDANRDGRLGLQETLIACQELSPNINEREVATLLSVVDGRGDGYVDYRQLLNMLTEESPGAGALPLHRSVHRSIIRDVKSASSPRSRVDGPLQWQNRPVTAPAKSIYLDKDGEAGGLQQALANAYHRSNVASVVQSLSAATGTALQLDPREGPADTVSLVPPPPTSTSRPGTSSMTARPTSRQLAETAQLQRPWTTPSSIKTQRFSRTFFTDTRHLTESVVNSAGYTDPSEAFVRKSAASDWMCFQNNDKAKKEGRMEAMSARVASKDAYETHRAVGDQVATEVRDASNLDIRGKLLRRHMERMQMYDVGRKDERKDMQPVFARLPQWNAGPVWGAVAIE